MDQKEMKAAYAKARDERRQFVKAKKEELEYQSVLRDLNKAHFEKMYYYLEAEKLLGAFTESTQRREKERAEQEEAIQRAFEEAKAAVTEQPEEDAEETLDTVDPDIKADNL